MEKRARGLGELRARVREGCRRGGEKSPKAVRGGGARAGDPAGERPKCVCKCGAEIRVARPNIAEKFRGPRIERSNERLWGQVVPEEVST